MYFPIKIRYLDSDEIVVIRNVNSIRKGVPFVVLETRTNYANP